jgi:hypothetical protein
MCVLWDADMRPSVSTYARAVGRRSASQALCRAMRAYGLSTYVCAVGRRSASQREYLCSCCQTQICV